MLEFCSTPLLTIASGGTAACVTAGRLAEADPSGVSEESISILLIQNRPDPRNWPTYP